MINDQRPILVVEDSDDDYLATSRAFKKACLRNPVYRCTNGDQALDFLYQRGEYEEAGSAPRPSIILLDLNLPGTDGRDVLREIKSDPALRNIPVIVLTTSASESDINKCYEAGANSYVQKPVGIGGFVEAITRIKNFWLELVIIPKEIE